MSSTTPPIDMNGEMTQANTLLRRWRKDLAKLPDNWGRWVAESLVAPYWNLTTTEESE